MPAKSNGITKEKDPKFANKQLKQQKLKLKITKLTVPSLWRTFSKTREMMIITAQTPETAHVGVSSSSLSCEPVLSLAAIALCPIISHTQKHPYPTSNIFVYTERERERERESNNGN